MHGQRRLVDSFWQLLAVQSKPRAKFIQGKHSNQSKEILLKVSKDLVPVVTSRSNKLAKALLLWSDKRPKDGVLNFYEMAAVCKRGNQVELSIFQLNQSYNFI